MVVERKEELNSKIDRLLTLEKEGELLFRGEFEANLSVKEAGSSGDRVY